MPVNKKYEDLIKKFISDEISDIEKDQLLSEAKKNKDIADLIKMHQQLSTAAQLSDIVTDKSFQEMRLRTINKINYLNDKDKKAHILTRIIDYIIYPFRIPLFSAAFAVALFFVGFFLNSSSKDFDLIRNIHYVAAKSNDLQGSINEPYIYQNATFSKRPDGKLNVSFDVTRHLDIICSKNDPLLQDILAQSLLNSTSLSTKLRNISDTRISMHPKIKQALIATMLNDNNPIVRQKSLFSLMKYKNDEDIQNALIKLLTTEKSVYMRLAAIDYLSNNNVDVSLLEKNIDSVYFQNNAVKQKLKQLK